MARVGKNVGVGVTTLSSCRSGTWRPTTLAVTVVVVLTTISCGTSRDLPPLPQSTVDGYALVVQDQFREAFAKAQATPDDATAVGALCRVLYAYGRMAEAAQCFERASGLEPESFDWLYYWGTVQGELGETEPARKTFEAASKLKPADLALAIRLADTLEAAGSQEEAIGVLTTALEEAPENSAVHYRLGRSYHSLGVTESLGHLEQAVTLDPEYREAHYALANAYLEAGRGADAALALTRYEASDPAPRRHYPDPLMDALGKLTAATAQTLFQEGSELMSRGSLVPARDALESVLDIDPRHAQAHVNLISVYGQLGDAAKATAHYQQAIALNDDLEEAHYNYGLLVAFENDFDSAIPAFTRALEINPQSAESHGNLGFALEQVGRAVEADEQYGLALEDDPSATLANFHRGRRLAESGSYRQALTHLERSLKMESATTPRALYIMALVHRTLGDAERARNYAAQCVEKAASYGQHDVVEMISREFER